MARIVITTYGSGGDFYPFIALALGLRARGHEILFAVEDAFEPVLERAGFALHTLPGDSEATLRRYHKQMFDSPNPLTPLRYLLEKDILPNLRAKVPELLAACAGADLLVSTALQPPAGFVAELTGIPWASVALTPAIFPSRHTTPYPPPLDPPFRFPRVVDAVYNRASWAVAHQAARRMMEEPVNAVRMEYGLRPVRDPLTVSGLSRRLTAIAVSPAFLPPPPDWSKHLKLTGFPFWETPLASTPPMSPETAEDLEAFLRAPGPVVTVSSGSMSPRMRGAFARFYRNSIAGVLQAGARALVVGAGPGILPDPLPEGAFAVPFVPFAQVYPRCAAVIHHGGIGTTAQALRSGVPMLVVPWGFDQFFAAHQVQRMGAGRWMRRRYYSPDHAATALRDLMGDPAYRLRTAAVACEIAREDGVATLCDELETLCPSPEPLLAARAG